MWVFGYTEWETDYNADCQDPTFTPVDHDLGEVRTFSQAVSELLKYVQNEMNEAEEYEMDNWSKLEADIRDIHDDPGIMSDPDMWEDTTFYDQYGTEFYIQQI